MIRARWIWIARALRSEYVCPSLWPLALALALAHDDPRPRLASLRGSISTLRTTAQHDTKHCKLVCLAPAPALHNGVPCRAMPCHCHVESCHVNGRHNGIIRNGSDLTGSHWQASSYLYITVPIPCCCTVAALRTRTYLPSITLALTFALPYPYPVLSCPAAPPL
jgi:hypothetical protein